MRTESAESRFDAAIESGCARWICVLHSIYLRHISACLACFKISI